MIRLIEAQNYRSLSSVRQPLRDFHVLIGPNGSGKTTFLDVVSFLSDLLSHGFGEAISRRSQNIHDLFSFHTGTKFKIAIEADIPKPLRQQLGDDSAYDTVRYELQVGHNAAEERDEILDEALVLQGPLTVDAKPRLSQGEPSQVGGKSSEEVTLPQFRSVIRKMHGSFYTLRPEQHENGWIPTFQFGPHKSALANVPDDEAMFPVTTWLRKLLVDGTRTMMLDSLALRRASDPGQGLAFKPDGSNLPWVIEALRRENPERFRRWIGHVQTALPDIEDIVTVELPDTRKRFLQVIYRGGFKVPSWLVSDGTLRMLALTLPAFLTHFEGIYLIEEPENGIHPYAMETVYEALRSVYSAQILLATHSPVILRCADLKDVLCFKKDEHGCTDIVRGDEHPALGLWQGKIDLADLFASGVL